jgi:glycosyltransferase involved in cell wall biosynthesis
MACGCPVVSSNTSSLPEVVGDAGIMVDPLGVDGMAEAIARVLSDAHLRQQMVAKGLAQASKFTWHRAAQETWRVYQKLGAVT